VRVDGARATARGSRAAWAWPLAGALVAGLAGAGGLVALWLGLPPLVAAVLTVGLQAMLTGAMHEDGLADCADGFWGGWTAERRLAIMKDSRSGAYGVVALVLVLMLRVTALAAVMAGPGWIAFLALGAMSRVPMAALQAGLRPARPGGLSDRTGRPSARTVGLAAGIALVIGVVVVVGELVPGGTLVSPDPQRPSPHGGEEGVGVVVEPRLHLIALVDVGDNPVERLGRHFFLEPAEVVRSGVEHGEGAAEHAPA
jgi:adenosylcobinamide-GDP ribazoletransferase